MILIPAILLFLLGAVPLFFAPSFGTFFLFLGLAGSGGVLFNMWWNKHFPSTASAPETEDVTEFEFKVRMEDGKATVSEARPITPKPKHNVHFE